MWAGGTRARWLGCSPAWRRSPRVRHDRADHETHGRLELTLRVPFATVRGTDVPHLSLYLPGMTAPGTV